ALPTELPRPSRLNPLDSLHRTPLRQLASGPATGRIQSLRDWWTGEDSNLRSPQGAADLQSSGFSHSPTRPRKKFQRNVNRMISKNKSITLAPRAKTQNGLVSRDTSPSILSSRIRSASLPCRISGGAGG